MALVTAFSYPKARPFKSYVDPNLSQAQKDQIQSNECKNAKFAGLSRSKVKTSIDKAPTHTHNSLIAFRNTLQAEVDMEGVVDALDKPWRDRSVQEQQNVRLRNIFLKAYNRESDNDYHLIICDSLQTIFFNVEVSALPSSSASSFNKLRSVRNNFETFPGPKKCGGKYIQFDPPLPIAQLNGSTFFDTDHAAGQVGPAGAKPNTAWEIHPVTLIEFK